MVSFPISIWFLLVSLGVQSRMGLVVDPKFHHLRSPQTSTAEFWFKGSGKRGLAVMSDSFEAFDKDYNAWVAMTQSLPFRRSDEYLKNSLELDLDHLCDHFDTVLADAAKGIGRYDCQKVATECLEDLTRVEAELECTSLSESDSKMYTEYCALTRKLFQELYIRVMPPEGFLGFRGSALRAFKFLVDELSFSLNESSPTHVVYSNACRVVEVAYSPQFPMGSIMISGCIDSELYKFLILDDFAYADGLGVMFDYWKYDLQNPMDIEKFLVCAADIIRRQASALLSGDLAAHKTIYEIASKRERLFVEIMQKKYGHSIA